MSAPVTQGTADPRSQTTPAEKKTLYVLPPPGGCYASWRGHSTQDFSPTARQALVMGAVEAALASGCFFNIDVERFCAKRLETSDAQLRRDVEGVAGGDFAYDVYLAREALRHRALWATRQRLFERLAPTVGSALGCLCIDGACTLDCVVTELSGLHIRLAGYRSNLRLVLQADALEVQAASLAAVLRGWRSQPLLPSC